MTRCGERPRFARWCAPIRRLAGAEPRPKWIVIAAEPITDVDTTAADMLADLDEELNGNGTSLVFAELKAPVRAKLERYELIGPLDPDHFFPRSTPRSRPYARGPALTGCRHCELRRIAR